MDLKYLAVKANSPCFISGFCAISVMMRHAWWRKKGDDLTLFPNYNKQDDIDKVKKQVQSLQTKLKMENEKFEGQVENFHRKLTKMEKVLTEKPKSSINRNTNLILNSEFWVGHFFIFRTYMDFGGENALIFFDKTLNDGGFNLMVHPFENEVNKKPSGGIRCSGLKTFLSKSTPVVVYDTGHFFLPEIEGMRNSCVIWHYHKIIFVAFSICLC